MAAKTVGFAISDDDREQLDALVEHFGGGNRSQFLRVAMRRLRHDMRSEQMQTLQQRAREESGGQILTPEEVTDLVRRIVRTSE